MRFLVLFLMVLLISPAVSADETKEFFHRTTSYDVYISGAGKHISVISNVEIKGFVTIAGKKFLVIRPSEFTLKNADGYILFESVQSILPNRKLKIHGANKLKIGY